MSTCGSRSPENRINSIARHTAGVAVLPGDGGRAELCFAAAELGNADGCGLVNESSVHERLRSSLGRVRSQRSNQKPSAFLFWVHHPCQNWAYWAGVIPESFRGVNCRVSDVAHGPIRLSPFT
jgi:hypothetical protein